MCGRVRRLDARAATDGDGQLSRVASTVISTLPFRAREIGQPSFAWFAASANDSWVAPGTTPRTTIAAEITVQPTSRLSAVTLTSTSSRSTGVPALARMFEQAIEKQEAWAAARGSSVLDAQVVGWSRKIPVVAAVTVPRPLGRSPLQVAVARRVVAMVEPPCVDAAARGSRAAASAEPAGASARRADGSRDEVNRDD